MSQMGYKPTLMRVQDACPADVRFTPKSGHYAVQQKLPFGDCRYFSGSRRVDIVQDASGASGWPAAAIAGRSPERWGNRPAACG